MKIIIYFILFTSLLLSCQKAIEIDREKIKPKLVINCILSPNQDTIKLSLSESRDLLYDKSDFPLVENATVSLFENGTKIGDLLLEGAYYILPYQVKAGATYRVEVTKAGFDAVSAETTVNTAPADIAFSAEKIESGIVIANMTITDIKNESSYYMATMQWGDITTDSTILNDPYYQPYFQSYNCTDDVIIEYPQNDLLSGSICASQFLFSDASFQNSAHTFTVYSPQNNYYFPQDGYKTIVVIECHTVNYDYYTYYLTRSIFQDNLGNPFAEPVPVYNNIENGFGIFGASTTRTDTLVFE
ncbi:MAG: DUF4249 domain-containing protein [Putridiphycobacter sp.]|nr:DUF4249 domain-containing protein [Putridiphycobacter sp.]